MSDNLMNWLLMGTQVPDFERRQQAADEITRLREQGRENYDAFCAMRNDLNEMFGDMISQEATLVDGPTMSAECAAVVVAMAKVREQLAEAKPKPYVSSTGEFNVVELYDAVEIDGKIYVAYDELMDSVDRHSKTVRALAKATSYAKLWAVAQWEKHFREDAPDWKPADDLLTLLMQLDNGSAGLGEKLAEAERQRDAARAGALEEAARVVEEFWRSPIDGTVIPAGVQQATAIRALIPQPAPTISPAEAAKVLLADNDVIFRMVRAANGSRAGDDEGEFEPLTDLLGFSGENKTHTVVRAAIVAALRAIAEEQG